MFEKVRDILSHQLKIDKSAITLESRIREDLDADSIDVLQLLMVLEEEYGIVIPDSKLRKFKTVGDIVEYLDSLSKKQK